MPIEFRCPSCARLLRTPDETAGKQAKCPQCGTVTEVPLTSNAAGPAGTGAGDGNVGGSPSPFGGSANPYATPMSSGFTPVTSAPVDEPGRTGLPWDRGPRSLGTYWETAQVVFKTPTEAFRKMAREGGLGIPVGYAVIGGLIGGFFSGIYNTAVQAILPRLVQAAAQGNGVPGLEPGSAIQIAIQLPIALIAGTVGTIIGLFFGSAINHLFLMMVGGAKQPFEATFRVAAYVQGTVALMQVVPLCGQYVAGLVALVYLIIGLAEAHRISVGRSAAAVLLQFVICLVCVGAVVGLFVVGVASSGAFNR